MKNYSQDGDVIPVTVAADTDAGSVVTKGLLVGVAVTAALAGDDVEIKTSGVHELPKTEAQAWTQGVAVYLTSGGVATTTSSGNTKIGIAAYAAANPSTTGMVKIGPTL